MRPGVNRHTTNLYLSQKRGGGNLSVSRERKDWYLLEAGEAAREMGADPEKGLSGQEAFSRLKQYGPNKMKEEKRVSPFILFINQFRNFMIYVLLAAAVIAGAALQEYVDAAVIMVIVIANAILGFVQEYRAERALESLKKLSAPTARVLRGGREEITPALNLVPGDIILLEAGDLVPADSRLLQAHSLRAEEASLTGESDAVTKTTAPLVQADPPLGDRSNMVYMGTHIVHGRGSGLVVATGSRTELGKIAEMLGEAEEEKTPLQVELDKVGMRIALLCIAICAFIFFTGVLRKLEWTQMLLFSVSLAVAAIPEGLPAIVTISLALGVRRMADENALLRRLHTVETLGCANVICTDKTGTLTRNEMEVQEIRVPGTPPLNPTEVLKEWSGVLNPLRPLLATASLCNDARVQEDGYLGEGTEIALLQMADRLGFPPSRAAEALPRREEIPFESERKMMSTINALADSELDERLFPFSSPFILLTKGAPEVVLERCDRFLAPDGVMELTESDREVFAAEAEEMADRALRTLAYACRPIMEIPDEHGLEELEKGLTYLGVTGMMDPPRPEAFEALGLCRKAHIEVVMITGDHAATARAVAEELSILTPDKEMITGEELACISDEELAERVERIAVYARVSPADKVKIVRAWKAKGKTVAMTGDGVNDAPALKNADIGVAMGITGTDVSKESSDMVLQDDNFATIVNAVREGRIIYDNLKKFIYFLLSCNMSEVSTMFIGMLFSSVTPLTAVQVLWMNLVTDGLPALALGMDTPTPDIMDRPPRDPNLGILNRSKQVMILWQGCILSVGALAAFFISYYLLFSDEAQVWTVVFTTLVFSQLLHSFNSRSESLSVMEMPLFDNKALWAAVAVSLALQLAVILIPPLMNVFKTAYVGASGWGLIAACSLLPVMVIDRVKVLLNRR